LGAILYLAGLSYERCEWFLAGLLGRKLMNMVTIWRDIQEIGRKSRKRGFPKGISLVIGLDGTYFKVSGKKVATMFASEAKSGITIWFDVRDERDKAAIKKAINELSQLYQIEGAITDDWELYKEPLHEKKIPHQVCLAHMKKNFKRRLSKIKEGALDIKERLTKLIEAAELRWKDFYEIAQDERLWLKENVKLREIIASLIRKWDYYTAYLKNPLLPTTNNVTERAILLSKVRYKTTRGLKSINGLGNFISATQLFGRQEFDEIAALIS
jgi:hypothetical protein